MFRAVSKSFHNFQKGTVIAVLSLTCTGAIGTHDSTFTKSEIHL